MLESILEDSNQLFDNFEKKLKKFFEGKYEHLP